MKEKLMNPHIDELIVDKNQEIKTCTLTGAYECFTNLIYS